MFFGRITPWDPISVVDESSICTMKAELVDEVKDGPPLILALKAVTSDVIAR